MDWKKYFILLPLFILIGILLIIYLPPRQNQYPILIVFILIFWAVYYFWVYIDKKRNKE
jgi:hypothetical protein